MRAILLTSCKYITRKSLLYKTGVEYGDYSLNHVQGCSHGCNYPCYAFLMAKRFGKVKSYEEWIRPKIVGNSLKLLEKEIPRHKAKIKSVHLCFTTDPFMYKNPEVCNLSYEIIEELNRAGISCKVLTKGLLPLELTNLSAMNQYGITLISLDESFRKRIEPGASPYRERIRRLRNIHEKGFKTMVSIEPYPTPNIIDQNLHNILEEINFVDMVIFGRMNYNKSVREYAKSKTYYNELSKQVIDSCSNLDIEYLIKNGTLTHN